MTGPSTGPPADHLDRNAPHRSPPPALRDGPSVNGLPSADLPISLVASAIVLQCHTMAEGLDWLPEDGVVLTCADLERIFVNLRALVAGTDEVDPNRSFAVDIAIAITHAIERESGGE